MTCATCRAFTANSYPRMADFALWATSMRNGILGDRYVRTGLSGKPPAAIEDLIDAHPVAARVRQIMANRSTWTGSASDLLRAGSDLAGPGVVSGAAAWPDCVGRSRSFEHWASSLPSVVKAELEPG